MCGIVGLVGYKDRKILERMNTIQTHRGPDSQGSYWDEMNCVGLAMRRLSIVDINGGLQPMFNEDESIALVFNGEIFNAPILRRELVEKGHQFKTKTSDTEVLIHLYEEEGSKMLNRLNGMFAFAIYDKQKQIVFIARDHMGIKPLHYIFDGKKIAFASELKSIVEANITERIIDRQSVWNYLTFQCVPAPRTIFEGVCVLPAAHFLIYDISESTLTVEKYWDCIKDAKPYKGRTKDLDNYVRTSIEDAIERWTMSDVPLACSLSGGLDSSVIAAIVSQKHSLHTYCLGFQNEKECDERELARALATKYRTNHEEIVLTPGELLKDIEEMLQTMDTPYGGGLPSWFVFKKIQGNEKVVFNGTGGDELFGNYMKWLRYEHPCERNRAYKKFKAYGGNAFEFILHPQGSIYHKYMSETMKKKIMVSSEEQYDNTNEYLQKMLINCPTKSWRDRIPYVDFKIQLPEEFLMMIDRFSMHFSIEARVPFLDRELVEKMMGIPGKMRTNSHNGKYLLKQSMGQLLPASFLTAPKQGFILPYEKWLRGELKESVYELCTGNFIKEQNIFSENLENEIVKPFYQGKEKLTPILWTVLMFQMWYRQAGAK